jgi:hypothetical protein
MRSGIMRASKGKHIKVNSDRSQGYIQVIYAVLEAFEALLRSLYAL